MRLTRGTISSGARRLRMGRAGPGWPSYSAVTRTSHLPKLPLQQAAKRSGRVLQALDHVPPLFGPNIAHPLANLPNEVRTWSAKLPTMKLPPERRHQRPPSAGAGRHQQAVDAGADDDRGMFTSCMVRQPDGF
jgi:hypothetical protein